MRYPVSVARTAYSRRGFWTSSVKLTKATADGEQAPKTGAGYGNVRDRKCPPSAPSFTHALARFVRERFVWLRWKFSVLKKKASSFAILLLFFFRIFSFVFDF